MKTIFKYPLDVVGEQTITVPSGAVPLAVQAQDGSLCLWAMVETMQPTMERRRVVRIFGTGHPVPPNHGAYVGTVQMMDGAFVWHVFLGPQE